MERTFERLTLEDISKEIHISRTTIYKVINNKGPVNESTRAAVLEALKKYHYVPNNNARNLALNRRYPIAYVGFESADAAYFAPTIEEGFRQAVNDYGDHGLAIKSYLASVQRPEQQAEDLHRAFADGIRHFIVAAADVERLKPVLLELRASGCTVLLLSKYAGAEVGDGFIGIDDYKSGQLAAEVLGHMVPAEGTLQVLLARESNSNVFSTRRKLDGFLDYIRNFRPSVTVLPVLKDLCGSGMIEEKLSVCLEQERPDGIYDLTYRLDVVAGTLRQRRAGNTALVGMDLFPEIVPYIKDHTIDAIIFQNLKAQAYLACKLLFEQMCYGKEMTRKEHHSKLEIVMRENLEYFLDI